MIRGGEGKRGDGGMPLMDLLQLMHRVFTNGGGDTTLKAKVFRRLMKLASSAESVGDFRLW